MAKLLKDTKRLLLKPMPNGLRQHPPIRRTHGINRNSRWQEDITRAHMVLYQGRSINLILPSNMSNPLRLHLNPTASQQQSSGRNNNNSSSSRAYRAGHNYRNRVLASRLMRSREGIQCREHHNSHIIMQLLRRLRLHRMYYTSRLHREEDQARCTVQARSAHTRMCRQLGHNNLPRSSARPGSSRYMYNRRQVDRVRKRI
jgi:hypothetical protein